MTTVPRPASGKPRLLVVNNMPAFYRTPLFGELSEHWISRTGGRVLVGYQVRRDSRSRGEWFFTQDDDLPFDHFFVSRDTKSSRNRTGYPNRLHVKSFLGYRPTHLFVAGWDSPLAIQSAAWARLTAARLGCWVESNPSTTRVKGGLSNGFRRRFLRSSDFVVVPTESSRDYVRDLAGRDLETVKLLNPVTVQRLPEVNMNQPNGKRVVFLGDFSHRKGFDLFQSLADRLAQQGWSSVAWGRDTESLAIQKSNVEARSAKPLASIVPELRPQDVLVIPSRKDPAPLTFSEALALGLRVVISDAVAYASDSRRLAGVEVARAGSVDSLAAAVLTVSEQPRPAASVALAVSPQHFAQSVVSALLGSTNSDSGRSTHQRGT